MLCKEFMCNWDETYSPVRLATDGQNGPHPLFLRIRQRSKARSKRAGEEQVTQASIGSRDVYVEGKYGSYKGAGIA